MHKGELKGVVEDLFRFAPAPPAPPWEKVRTCPDLIRGEEDRVVEARSGINNSA